MSVKLSIITVCRNEAANIRKTADSVVGQTCPDFEWIVIDGGSTDGTLEILNEYRPRMAHLVSEPDGGVYDAMNKAACLARGEWWLFLNGGDGLAGPEVVAGILPLLGERGEDILVGAHLCVWPDGRPPLLKAHPGTSLDLHHFYRWTVNHQSTFIGRRVFERFGPYDVSFRLLGDYDFFVRSVLGGIPFRCVPNLIAEYDMTGMSAKMKDQKNMVRERRRIRGRYSFGYRVRRFGSDWIVACRNLLAGAQKGPEHA
jgi:glycosyltransferase involved in cell wall biosynthesis